MPYVTINEDVWVDLDDFDTDDLIEEIKNRGAATKSLRYDGHRSGEEILNDIYLHKVRGQNYEQLINELIYVSLGKIC